MDANNIVALFSFLPTQLKRLIAFRTAEGEETSSHTLLVGMKILTTFLKVISQ